MSARYQQCSSCFDGNGRHTDRDRTITGCTGGAGILRRWTGHAEPDRVFDPFYTTRPVGQGPGLGLSVCYGIIQEHNGKIACQNRPEGGAIFRIELPAAMDSALSLGMASRSYRSPEPLPEAKAAGIR